MSAATLVTNIKILSGSLVHTSVRCGHGCRDGSAHGHDGQGKEGEDVLSVHFDTRWGRLWLVRVVFGKDGGV